MKGGTAVTTQNLAFLDQGILFYKYMNRFACKSFILSCTVRHVLVYVSATVISNLECCLTKLANNKVYVAELTAKRDFCHDCITRLCQIVLLLIRIFRTLRVIYFHFIIIGITTMCSLWIFAFVWLHDTNRRSQAVTYR